MSGLTGCSGEGISGVGPARVIGGGNCLFVVVFCCFSWGGGSEWEFRGKQYKVKVEDLGYMIHH